MREYRGIQLMLNEAHIPYDIIEDSQLHHLRQKLEQYRVIILPEITELDQQSIEVLNHLVFNGTSLVATNKTLTGNPGALRDLFGAVPDSTEFEGSGNYLRTGLHPSFCGCMK